MKRVVVTGASGFIGAYLIQELLKDTENEIYAVIRPNSSNRDRVPQDDRVKIVELDMAQIEELPSYVPDRWKDFITLPGTELVEKPGMMRKGKRRIMRLPFLQQKRQKNCRQRCFWEAVLRQNTGL